MSSNLLAYSNNNEKPQQTIIRDGIAGNYDIVYQMVRLVRETVLYNKAFQDLINKEFIKENVGYYDSDNAKMKAVFEYVTRNVAYSSDVAGKVESIKSAPVTLSDGYGDCDDLAILYASILGVLGYEPKFVLASYSPDEQQFSHIYTEVTVTPKGGWKGEYPRFVFDNAINPPSFNREVTPYKTSVIDVLNSNETDSFTGIIKQIGLAFNQFYKHSLDVIPTLAGFTPIGALAYTALATGASVASSGLDKSLSLNELGSRIHRQLDSIIEALHKSQIAGDYAVVSAIQIASQLAGYQVSTRYEQKQYLIISKSIKQKLQFIKDYIKNNNYNVTLNHSGMVLAGGAVIGYFGYQAYKHLSK
jgi:hypothetical protein